MRKFVIMCGGYYEQFDKPKALTKVQGETLAERTIRLLQEAGVPVKNIYISANDSKFEAFGVQVLHHINTYSYEGGKMCGYWLDAFYPNFPQDTKVTYLYGDVVYTKEALDTIIHCEKKGNILFGSGIARNKNHRNWGEPFAYKVDDYRGFLIGISCVKAMYDAGRTDRHPITWELYRFLNGLNVNKQVVLDRTYVAIDDGTIDIDAPIRADEAERRVDTWTEI